MPTRSAPRPGDLDLYEDPAWYDATYRRRRRDVQFYVDAARAAGGPVLEYGVGSGRVALATARAGIDVVGVELSDPMLHAFQAKLARLPPATARRIRLVRGDMRSVRLSEQFALVTAPFNVVLHLDSRRDMERWLQRVRQHLAPGARLLFDVSVPQPLDLGAASSTWRKARRFRHPVTGRWTEHSERFDYDPIRQVLLVESELWPEGAATPARVPLVHRQWFPRELEAVLHYNGFADIRFTADFTQRPPGPEVDALIVSACAARPKDA